MSYGPIAPFSGFVWLTYFHFDRNTPLIIDEWNFDLDANILAERSENSYIAASYIPVRIKNMYDAGINNQVYFSLQDFDNKRETIVRNVGVFNFDAAHPDNKVEPKPVYNVFRMLRSLGKDMFTSQLDDEFSKAFATRSGDTITAFIYNYIDPQAARNYLSRNIVNLSSSERKVLVNIIKTDKLHQIMDGSIDPSTLHLTNRIKIMLDAARQLNDRAKKQAGVGRNLKINIKNLKDSYTYQLYSVDSNCKKSCLFAAREEKEIAPGDYQGTFLINPYSVNMIVLKVKPKEEPAPTTPTTPPAKEEEKK